jgi:hypothetical protein
MIQVGKHAKPRCVVRKEIRAELFTNAKKPPFGKSGWVYRALFLTDSPFYSSRNHIKPKPAIAAMITIAQIIMRFLRSFNLACSLSIWNSPLCFKHIIPCYLFSMLCLITGYFLGNSAHPSKKSTAVTSLLTLFFRVLSGQTYINFLL